MLTEVVTVGFLATSAFAAQGFSPAHQFGAMVPRGDLAKRQGYYPSTHYCGQGDTCEEACGEGYETCPSNTVDLYCYNPTVGDTCCPDGTGNSCEDGYYCSHDGAGTTYCCPEDMSLSDCAAAYSLTVSLIAETGSVSVPASTAGPGATTAVTTTTPIHVSYPTAYSYSTGGYSYSYSTGGYSTQNATYSTAAPPEFTGAAAKIAGAGMAVLAGAAGVAGFL